MTQKVLEENMKEIQRRKQVDDSDHSFEKTGSCNLPLKLVDQNFVLFSTTLQDTVRIASPFRLIWISISCP